MMHTMLTKLSFNRNDLEQLYFTYVYFHWQTNDNVMNRINYFDIPTCRAEMPHWIDFNEIFMSVPLIFSQAQMIADRSRLILKQ